ncbi:MAG: hypothetical protein PHG58_11445 [Clostridia bacterium]|nr:hypothetical protein [Clostridia bacterium]
MYCRSLQIQPQLTYEQANIINEFRVLLSQLTYLTRFYIIEESIAGLGDPQDTINELLKLPIKGNELIKSIEGVEGDFTPITESYITGVKNLIDAIISGDQKKADESIRQLYEIADQNAKFLAELSPYWDEEKWRDLFYILNRDLVAEVIAIQTGDYNKALDIFERSMEEALKRADYYAEGVIHLLPEDQQKVPITYFNMIKDFRKLRTEWAYLTRFYIVARIVGFGDEGYVTQRLYELTQQMKEKFELILGTEVAHELLNHLSIYIIRTEELINAILSGDQAAIEAQTNAFYQYGDNLSAYLGSINPYWDETVWKQLFNTSAEFIIKESYEFLTKDYAAAMKTFEELLYSFLAIGDYFALGLYQYATM